MKPAETSRCNFPRGAFGGTPVSATFNPCSLGRVGLMIALVLMAIPATLAMAGTDNPSKIGPGSGLVGSFSPGGVGGDSLSDMGNGEENMIKILLAREGAAWSVS